MKSTYSTLMSSRYFNPAFNSAIFDGPVRIYFAQFQESLALKIYFSLAQKHQEEMKVAKENYRRQGRNVLVLLYPNTESFSMSFDNSPQQIQTGEAQGDTVIGINGPFEDDFLVKVTDTVIGVFKEWESKENDLSIPKFVEALS